MGGSSFVPFDVHHRDLHDSTTTTTLSREGEDDHQRSDAARRSRRRRRRQLEPSYSSSSSSSVSYRSVDQLLGMRHMEEEEEPTTTITIEEENEDDKATTDAGYAPHPSDVDDWLIHDMNLKRVWYGTTYEGRDLFAYHTCHNNNNDNEDSDGCPKDQPAVLFMSLEHGNEPLGLISLLWTVQFWKEQQNNNINNNSDDDTNTLLDQDYTNKNAIGQETTIRSSSFPHFSAPVAPLSLKSSQTTTITSVDSILSHLRRKHDRQTTRLLLQQQQESFLQPYSNDTTNTTAAEAAAPFSSSSSTPPLKLMNAIFVPFVNLDTYLHNIQHGRGCRRSNMRETCPAVVAKQQQQSYVQHSPPKTVLAPAAQNDDDTVDEEEQKDEQENSSSSSSGDTTTNENESAAIRPKDKVRNKSNKGKRDLKSLSSSSSRKIKKSEISDNDRVSNIYYCPNSSHGGVDLNRNHPADWSGVFADEDGDDDSLGSPCGITYKGSEPWSEPESQAIRDLVWSYLTNNNSNNNNNNNIDNTNNIVAAMSFHTRGDFHSEGLLIHPFTSARPIQSMEPWRLDRYRRWSRLLNSFDESQYKVMSSYQRQQQIKQQQQRQQQEQWQRKGNLRTASKIHELYKTGTAQEAIQYTASGSTIDWLHSQGVTSFVLESKTPCRHDGRWCSRLDLQETGGGGNSKRRPVSLHDKVMEWTREDGWTGMKLIQLASFELNQPADNNRAFHRQYPQQTIQRNQAFMMAATNTLLVVLVILFFLLYLLPHLLFLKKQQQQKRIMTMSMTTTNTTTANTTTKQYCHVRCRDKASHCRWVARRLWFQIMELRTAASAAATGATAAGAATSPYANLRSSSSSSSGSSSSSSGSANNSPKESNVAFHYHDSGDECDYNNNNNYHRNNGVVPTKLFSNGSRNKHLSSSGTNLAGGGASGMSSNIQLLDENGGGAVAAAAAGKSDCTSSCSNNNNNHTIIMNNNNNNNDYYDIDPTTMMVVETILPPLPIISGHNCSTPRLLLHKRASSDMTRRHSKLMVDRD